VNCLPQAVYCIDPKGRVVYANDSACRMLGRARDELCSLSFSDIDSHCSHLSWGVFWQETRNRGSWEMSSQHQRKAGEIFPVQVTASYMRCEEHEYCIALVHESAEENNTTAVNSEERAKFQAIFEGVETGIFIIDPEEHRIVDANPVALQLVGAPPNKVLGAICHKFVCPADTGRCPVTDLGQTVDNSERVLLTFTGEQRSIIKTVRPVEMGGHGYLLESFLDITERKRAEKALEERTAYLNTLIESSPVGTVVLDKEERVQMSNSAFERLFLYSREELQGVSLSQLIASSELSMESDYFTQECLSGRSIQVSSRRRRKDGVLVDVDVYGVPLMIGGAPQGILALYQDVTERKRIEAELRESEDRFRTAFEEAPHGMCMTALDGRFLHANAALCQMLGYSQQELLAGAWQGITYPEDLELSQQAAARFSDGVTNTQELEKRYVHKEGKIIWARLKISVVRNNLGEPSHYISQTEDITLRKQAEQALQSSEEKFRQLAENISEVFWMMPPAGNEMLYVSPAYEQVWGRSRDSLYRNATSWTEAIHPDDVAQAHSTFARQLRGEQVDSIYRIRTPEGQEKWIRDRAFPVRDQRGQLTRIVGVAEDISERKATEERLLASEERYRELFENASDLVYTYDLDMQITSVNRLAEQTIGYTRDEATQMNLRQLANPEHWERVQKGLARLVENRSPVKFEVEIKAKDGRRVMLEVNHSLISRNGKPVGVQGIARDITGRDVEEVELRQAQKLESVGRLASGIAHEINTPIQFVGDNVRFLQDSFGELQAIISKFNELCRPAVSVPSVQDLSTALEQIESASDCGYLLKEIPKALTQTLDGVERVVTIVRAMKEFAHPETKGMVPADLNKALLNTLTVARNELKYVADVETDFGDLPLVVCSVGDMNQVFLNLLVNAAHAIGDVVKGTGKKGKIRVRTKAEGAVAMITVSDTGAGIPENIRDRVFDPFFTTKEVGRGTGQGLAIARSVVERHKGNLTFESQVGKGTTFYVRLPIDDSEPQETT